MNLFVAGINYRTAPVELREPLAMARGALQCQACRLRMAGNLEELVLLSTCNRVELYGAAPLSGDRARLFFRLLRPHLSGLEEHVFVREGSVALEHLFKVTAALDSMILGETEITGQVKQAYEQARTAGLTGRILNQAFQKALKTAKEIRSRTGIGRGATSVGSAAAVAAERIFGAALEAHPVLILGAGQMGEACARHLAKRGAKTVLVANRSPERAQVLAAQIGGAVIPFERWQAALERVDVFIASTACPAALLSEAELRQLMPARRGRPLFLLDISVPRNIDPAVQTLDNVYLYNIDDLQAISRQNLCQRERALAECDGIISRAVAELCQRLDGRPSSYDGAPATAPRWLASDLEAPAAA